MSNQTHATKWPLITLEVDETRGFGGGICVYGLESGAALYDGIALVHVMSVSAGGEIRGYAIHDGTAYLRRPAYTGDWPEMDAEVSRVLGVPVVGISGATTRTPKQAELFGGAS